MASDSGAELSLASVSAPSLGTAIVELGQVRFTTPVGGPATTSFAYSISDRQGADSASTVNIVIVEPTLLAPRIYLPNVFGK